MMQWWGVHKTAVELRLKINSTQLRWRLRQKKGQEQESVEFVSPLFVQ